MGSVFAIEGLASLHCNQNQPKYAAWLIGWADAMREKIGDPRPLSAHVDVDKDIAACIAKMGEVAFSNAYGAGKNMTADGAVALALKET